MKVIFKINEYISDTRQISVSMCKSTSRQSIDEHKKILIDLDLLDYYDSESFVEALIDRSAGTRIKEDNAIEVVLPDNVSEVITGDINILDIVGKVIEGEISEWYGRKKEPIKMNKVDL